MNYIIISDNVKESLKNRFHSYCETYNYLSVFDDFIVKTLSFDGIFRLCNKSRDGLTYELIGKGCLLVVETYRRSQNCFYAKRIQFFTDDSKYLSKLGQTIELPGEWNVITLSEVSRIDTSKIDDISYILETIKINEAEFYKFENEWKTWDLYNTKLEEAEKIREVESEGIVTKVLLENNIFTIQLSDWKEQYEEEASIAVQYEKKEGFDFLGIIISTNAKAKELCIRCENYDFVANYIKNRVEKIEKIRVVEYGTKARLKRQRNAMKKLYQEETANPNLKEIVMGGYIFKELDKKHTMEEAYKLFGSNIRQKEAYLGALNTDDIFLIQGPPGTGKTTIITELVKYIIGQGMRVLVSSETNIAVDNVLERIQDMENVIPIRLGRKERIGETCLPFLPEHVSNSILEASKTKIEEFNNNLLAFDHIIMMEEKKWKEKISQVENKIYRLQEMLPNVDNYNRLFDSITNFESLVLEANEIYKEVKAKEEEYYKLQELKEKLQQKENKLKALCSSSKIMASGLKEADESIKSEYKIYYKELEKVKEQLDEISLKLMKNTYEAKKGLYNMRRRKVEREKRKFEKMITYSTSFSTAIHDVKEKIRDIQVLQAQKKQYEKDMTTEIEMLKMDYEYKLTLWNENADIREEWLEALDHTETREDIETIYMKQTNAVFATCSGIASFDNKSFATMEYDYVIIDEAAKCNMLDLLIPLIMGKKIILVGDHKQLYPMIESDGMEEALSQEQFQLLRDHILFKWLYEERVPDEYKIMLNSQYRMPYHISQFISESFYENNLKCEKEKNDDTTMLWIDCEKSEEKLNGTSYENVAEAETIINLVKKLDRDHPHALLGIICVYKAQARRISEMLKRIDINLDVECNTVDAFQGKEKQIIIFNFVRSDRVTSFMANENRVNVAVSRAQEYLYIVGKAELMKRKEAGVLGKLYDYIKLYGKIYNSRYVFT